MSVDRIHIYCFNAHMLFLDLDVRFHDDIGILYYVMLGAAPNGGFEARRRMGFAHFDGPFANGAWFKRRSGAALYTITKVTVAGNNISMSLENGAEIVGALKGNSIEGRIFREGKPIDRIWLVKRTDPITWESNYALWPGESSRPTF